MPPELEHSYQNSILTVKLVEEYSMQEFLDGLESCFNRYAPNQPIGVIVDATRSQSRRSLDEIRRYMPRIGQWKGKVVAFSVIVASDFLFGLTNQTSVYAQMIGVEVRPFRDMNQGLAWIQEKLALLEFPQVKLAHVS